MEFNFLKAQAQEPLSTFLEYITYEYMIENIMMLLKGTLSGRDVNELIEQCHPMVRDTRTRGERQTECRGVEGLKAQRQDSFVDGELI